MLTAAKPPVSEVMFLGGRQQGWQSQWQKENCPKLPGENAPSKEMSAGLRFLGAQVAIIRMYCEFLI